MLDIQRWTKQVRFFPHGKYQLVGSHPHKSIINDLDKCSEGQDLKEQRIHLQCNKRGLPDDFSHFTLDGWKPHKSVWICSGKQGVGKRAPWEMCEETSAIGEDRIMVEVVCTTLLRCLSCAACLGNLSKREANLVGTVGQEGVICELVTFLVTFPRKSRDLAWSSSLLSDHHLTGREVFLQRQWEEEEEEGEEVEKRMWTDCFPCHMSYKLLSWPQLHELPQMNKRVGWSGLWTHKEMWLPCATA